MLMRPVGTILYIPCKSTYRDLTLNILPCSGK
uniref:Uncharacterized protein n=1 Tax=Anguilla anguilla TaxID=7936 RepID=A0A0E9QDZ8_ANGAN